MYNQKWKEDPKLYNAPTKQDGLQIKKKLDYHNIYVKEFLDCDPLRDWESVDRSIWLWNWMLEQIGLKEENVGKFFEKVLDVGTKDAQFPMWLREQYDIEAIGCEISKPYIEWAKEKGRPIEFGDACDLPYKDMTFDLVFSHHLHGLTPDYYKALDEMFRVSRKFMLALNQVPGNPRKHYSYIDNPKIYDDFVENNLCDVIHNGYLETGFKNEWVILIDKDYTPSSTLLSTVSPVSKMENSSDEENESEAKVNPTSIFFGNVMKKIINKGTK